MINKVKYCHSVARKMIGEYGLFMIEFFINTTSSIISIGGIVVSKTIGINGG